MKFKVLKFLVFIVWLATPSLLRAQFTFTTNGSALTLTAYTGSSASVLILAQTNGYTVTSIGPGAFQGNLVITNVIVAYTVTNIGNNAFVSCSNLTAVYFQGDPPTVGTAFSDPTIVYYFSGTTGWTGMFGGVFTQQGGDPDYSFNMVNGTASLFTYFGTNLQVTIPTSLYGAPVKSLGSSIFNSHRAITSVTLPNTLTNISPRVFSSCTNLTSLNIPSSVISLGDQAFLRCNHLTNITVDAASTNFIGVGGLLFDKSQTKLVAYPSGLPGASYAVSSGVLAIGNNAFEAVGALTNVTLPNGLITIGASAFASCSNLVTMFIPNGVQNLGSRVFDACSSLRSVNIPDAYTAYGLIEMFRSANSLTNISVNPANAAYTSVGGAVFDKAQQVLVVCPPGLNNYIIPQGVVRIETDAFSSPNLTNVVVAYTVTSISLFGFDGCPNLASIYFQGNPPAIDTPFSGVSATVYYFSGTSGWTAFFGGLSVQQGGDPDYSFSMVNGTVFLFSYFGTNLQVTIPKSFYGAKVVSLATGTFNPRRNVTSVTLPDTVTNLAIRVFFSCSNLTSVSIPAGVISIGDEAFARCNHLTNITVDAASTNFSGVGGLLFDKAQTKLVDYPSGLPGGSYTVSNGVLAIGNTAFEANGILTNVTLPNGLITIGASAFFSCTNLVSVTIPNSVQTLAQRAFSTCTSLKSIHIPDSLAPGFGEFSEVFIACSSLTNLSVNPANPAYSSVGGVLFDKLQQNIIVFPAGLSGSYTIPNGVLSIGAEAFVGCVGLTNVFVPNSVTDVGPLAFSSCVNLMSIYFQGNAPTVTAPYPQIPATVYYLPGTTGWDSTFAGLPTAALTYPGYNFTVSGGSIVISQFTGSGNQTAIPGSIDGVPVTGIVSGAFQFNFNLKSVTIPASVTNIANSAFSLCPNLQAIYFLGNAPTAANGAFASPQISYYLPGTTGWGTSLGGVPAVLWNPQPTQLAVTSGQFGFHLTGPANLAIVVEACTNLANPSWAPLSTNTLTGGNSAFADPQWTNYPGRYYRLRSP